MFYTNEEALVQSPQNSIHIHLLSVSHTGDHGIRRQDNTVSFVQAYNCQ